MLYCYISQIFGKRNKLIYILDGLRLSKCFGWTIPLTSSCRISISSSTKRSWVWWAPRRTRELFTTLKTTARFPPTRRKAWSPSCSYTALSPFTQGKVHWIKRKSLHGLRGYRIFCHLVFYCAFLLPLYFTMLWYNIIVVTNAKISTLWKSSDCCIAGDVLGLVGYNCWRNIYK